MKSFVIELIGFVMLAFSLGTLFQFIIIDAITVLDFKDGTYEFAIDSPGYYSISIHGAGFVQERQKVVLKLILNNRETLEANVNSIPYWFRKEERIGIEYWGFSTSKVGHCTIVLSNLEHVLLKSSMLISKRTFEKPLDHSKLKILVYKSIEPLYKLIFYRVIRYKYRCNFIWNLLLA